MTTRLGNTLVRTGLRPVILRWRRQWRWHNRLRRWRCALVGHRWRVVPKRSGRADERYCPRCHADSIGGVIRHDGGDVQPW